MELLATDCRKHLCTEPHGRDMGNRSGAAGPESRPRGRDREAQSGLPRCQPVGAGWVPGHVCPWPSILWGSLCSERQSDASRSEALPAQSCLPLSFTGATMAPNPLHPNPTQCGLPKGPTPPRDLATTPHLEMLLAQGTCEVCSLMEGIFTDWSMGKPPACA